MPTAWRLSFVVKNSALGSHPSNDEILEARPSSHQVNTSAPPKT